MKIQALMVIEALGPKSRFGASDTSTYCVGLFPRGLVPLASKLSASPSMPGAKLAP